MPRVASRRLPFPPAPVVPSLAQVIKNMLGGLLSRILVIADWSETFDKRSSAKIFSCLVRLRLTRLKWWRLSRRGTYRVSDVGGEGALRRVEVTFPQQKGGSRKKFRPWLRTGDKTQVEITYLSQLWRVCRAGGVMFAFTKKAT